MSTADDIEAKFYEWLHDDPMRETERKHDSVVSGLLITYEAGYRRGLEDAAEVVKSRFEHGRLTTDECELVETWLRDRAAGVGTKDGDDDE